MKTNMTKEQVCKILACEQINYVCRMAGRLLPNCAASIIAHTASHLSRWAQVSEYIRNTDCDSANKQMHYQIPAAVWAEMQEAAR